MQRRTALALAIGVAALFHPHVARGQDAVSADAPSPKRALPIYDGRGQPDDGANAGVWLARIFLSPLYFLSEYVIRQPLNALMAPLEAHDDLTKIYDFFSFGPDHKIGFFPIIFVDFGFNPSVGALYYWDDAFVPNNHIRGQVDLWPTDWFAGALSDFYVWDNKQIIQLRADGMIRPDQVYYGIGPNSVQGAQSRFRRARFDMNVKLQNQVWRSSQIRTWAGLRKVDLSDGHYGSDPSLSEEAKTGAFPDCKSYGCVNGIPYGFNQGYTSPYALLDVALDTRDAADPRSGLRLEAEGDVATDVAHNSTGWVHYGGTASVFFELKLRRILSITAHASFADPLGSGYIPYTELVSLGGEKWMFGYFPDRLLGRSAAVGMLRYAWPIASWLDGTIEAVVGNVFNEHLDGFHLGELRFSGSIGVTTTGNVLSSFAGAGTTVVADTIATPRVEVVAGFGTDTFERGAAIQSFHLSLGVPFTY